MFTPHGVIPALVTPLDHDGELLEGGLRDLLDYTLSNGVHGVFVLGTSGEIYGLTHDQKRRVVEITVEHVAGRVPVYAGASEITTRDCVATAKMIASVGGVDAISVLTPYFLVPTQDELVEHFAAIAAATDLPVLLYSNPGKTHVPLPVTTVLRLAQIPTIIGIKDSSGDLDLLKDYLREMPEDFTVLVGKDTLILEALTLGAAGCIASTANVAPAVVAGIYDAFHRGDLDAARALQLRLNPLRALVDQATFPVVLKEGLRLAGVETGYCLAPASHLDDAVRDQLVSVVADLTIEPLTTKVGA